MGRILYIFPHPDDESFGPGPAIAYHHRLGHDAYLLTLTRGGATSQREKYGYTKEEMGEVRYREMQDVAQVLGLAGLTVLDFADKGLAESNPLELEAVVEAHMRGTRPEVVVTYAVHGVSGHPDHLVTHAVVKHVYAALRAAGEPYLKRLAFFTLPENGRSDRPDHLKGSPDADIDCLIRFEKADRAKAAEALACYVTYQDVVAAQDPLLHVAEGVCFELFQESHTPPLPHLFAQRSA